MNYPNEALPYILADAGFDVWLGNNRGNGVSTINVKYGKHTQEYWDFSWDEMALIDLPSQINYVLQQTGVQQLSYIGHSEGTIQAFSGFVANTTLASQVNLYVALAPVAYVQYVESLIIQALAALRTEDIYFLLGIKEFTLPGAIDILLPGVCTIDPEGCEFIISLLCGPTTYLNDTRISYYSRYEPNPTSVKNMAHWAQGVRAGTFSMYDYGKQGNIQHYNQPQAPQYNLAEFPKTLPTALFCGGKDYLADPKDVERLLTLLPTPPFVHYEENYAHLDPLIGINAYQRIYPIILEMLDNIWVNQTAPF
jgi:pimeloyl-ACP methyl ester carboxylesterase